MSRAALPPPIPVIDAPIVDAHTHSWSAELAGDHREVMQRAWAAGLAAIIEVGGDVASSEQALALARADARVHAVAGIHPHEAHALAEQRDHLERLVAGGEFVAVGEIGLDFYRNLSPVAEQYEALLWQLELALEYHLPVVIHSRNADEDCFNVLDDWARRAGRYLGPDREIGMMHCYAGDLELAKRYLALGFLISVPGVVTYPDNARGQEVARSIPLAGMLIETDAPYLTPVPRRGKRNEPAYVAYTAAFVAGLRGVTAESVARATAENAARLFGFTL